jgi:hypothetical protein
MLGNRQIRSSRIHGGLCQESRLRTACTTASGVSRMRAGTKRGRGAPITEGGETPSLSPCKTIVGTVITGCFTSSASMGSNAGSLAAAP